MSAPVVAIDGPSGSGKGTLSQMLAARLGFHYLDSGALYRLLALAAQRHHVAEDNLQGLATLAEHLDIQFRMNPAGGSPHIIFEGEDVSERIRTEDIGERASRVAAIPAVRVALLQRQRAFAAPPGLVADGRDMGTVVFPDAEVKIYLTASPEERAARRHKQLIDKGESVSLAALVEQVRARDERDINRSASPLRPAEGAIRVDTSGMTIPQVFDVLTGVLDKTLGSGREAGLKKRPTSHVWRDN